MEDQKMEKLLKQSLMAAAETGADLLDILQTIVDRGEYDEENDFVKLDPETFYAARSYLFDFRAPMMTDNDTLH